MDPNKLNNQASNQMTNQLNSQLSPQMNQLNQLNQMSYYQNYVLNNENKTEQTNLNNLYSNYQSYYGSGTSNLGNLNNNLSNHLTNLGNLNSLSSANTNYLSQQLPHCPLTPEKPWTKASKDPSMIQKGTELFVGNLSLDTNEADLFEVFRDCGDIIDIRVHKNLQTKKCYAFIRFLSKEMLRNALNKNMTTLKGRKMKVTKSNENSTIFIGNIRKNWSNVDVETKVKRIFPNCEKIEHFPDPNHSNKNRGFCFVMFKNRNEAIKALNYVASKGGINIDGVPLTCDWADVVDEDDSNSKQIFIAGLDDHVDEAKIREVFSVYGNITDVVLSKMHKSSKRKDLAFVTFNTHEEAKTAVDLFKGKFISNEQFNETSLEENEYSGNIIMESIKVEDALSTGKEENPLGPAVNISLAFSQQAMQAKKKIKESRKRVPMPTPIVPTGSNIPVPAIPAIASPITNPALPTSFNKPNFDATAMLAMMNLINLNKNNMNISPTLMTQMMAACFESMMNQNTTVSSVPSTTLPVTTSPSLNPISNLNTSTTNLNANLSTSLNSNTQINPLITPLNPPTNQILNLGSSKLNNKRLKKLYKKKRPTSILNPTTSTNPHSA